MLINLKTCLLMSALLAGVYGTGNQACGQEFADRITLRSGAELRVNILAQPQTASGESVVFETPSGATVKLQRKLVASIVEADEAHGAYLNHLKTRDDSVQWHREMIDWCKSQPRGRTKFKDEIRYHLEMIIQIDPEDVRSRKLLGYERVGPGQWMLESLLLDQVWLRGRWLKSDSTFGADDRGWS